MLQYIIQVRTYLNLKSGLLLDYYIKLILITITKHYFLVNNLLFTDKFIIEFLATRLFTVYYSMVYFFNYFNKLSLLYAFNLVIFLFFYFIVIIFIICF